jgi:sigma-B regulation protein RsbU (phosphoserine phosphatase)
VTGETEEATRFDALIPRWLFVIRPPLLRYLAALVVPLLLWAPLITVADGEALRLGPVIVLGLIVVAGSAGSGPAAIAGVAALLAYWRDGVPPPRSFALDDLSSHVAVAGMFVIAGGLPILTRRIEQTVDGVRRLDRERIDAAVQAGAVTTLATAIAAEATPEGVANVALDHLAFPRDLTGSSIALVVDDHMKVLASRGATRAVIDALESADLRRSDWLLEVLAGTPAIIDDRDDFAAKHPGANVLRLYASGCWAVIPFRYQQTVGLLSVHSAIPQPLSNHADYFALVAAVLAAALERARAQAAHLLEVETSLAQRDRIARTLSTTLLPPRLPSLPGFSAAGWIVPANDGEVAGDFYDLFAVGEGEWVAILGDVCGKGAEAAAVASLARYAARTTALIDPDPAAIAEVADRALREDSSSLFCTMAVVRFNRLESTITVALAGHPQMRCLSPSGIRRIGRHGTALGMSFGGGVQLDTQPFGPGDTVLLFSDGLIERSIPFDDDALDEALARIPDRSAPALSEQLRALALGLPADHPDDIAILAVTDERSHVLGVDGEAGGCGTAVAGKGRG